MSSGTLTTTDFERLDRLIAAGEKEFTARQPRSAEFVARARRSLAGGVTSNWQIAWPAPIWMSHGKGSKVVDVDGGEYVDLHGGYGVNLVGHAHPKIAAAVSERVTQGTHFAQPTEDAIVVAKELARRFGLPLWRFCNSGTEATMDVVHLMRAATGRDLFIKIEGCYHGHHDSVMVSVYNSMDELGPVDAPSSPPSGAGLPSAITDLTVIVPYNDLDAMERAFARHEGEIAGVILEPIMMNAGIIPPANGYLEGVRDIAHANEALLAFDEVKTGLTVAPGGATEYSGVTPDLICLAKAIGGGLAGGAIGGTREIMGLIEAGEYEQVGTFNGNPLWAAAARATLTEIMDDDAYAHLGRLRKHMIDGASSIIQGYELPGYALGFGAKGSITFSETPIRNYRDFLGVDDRFSHGHWLFQHNGGVFLPPWGKAEQWMLSVQHTEDDIDIFLDNLEAFARALRE